MVGSAFVPYLSWYFRPSRFIFDSSVDEWFLSALKGEDALPVVTLAAVPCIVAGVLLCLLLAKMFQPGDGGSKGGGMSLLRTPLAAGILIPFAFAVGVLVVYNHTTQVFYGIVWPDFYFKNVIIYSVIIGMTSLILSGFLNQLERTFPNASVFRQFGTLCCIPLAFAVGLATLAGVLGAGLLGGLGIGYWLHCPLTGTWMGGLLAAAFLVTQRGILWPAYFPLTVHGGT
jgi:hypothetical protein